MAIEREKRLTEPLPIRLPEGSTRRIDRVLKGGELRSAFAREAVERELQRREGLMRKREAAE